MCSTDEVGSCARLEGDVSFNLLLWKVDSEAVTGLVGVGVIE